MDFVRSSYINKMKNSSMTHLPLNKTISDPADITMQEAAMKSQTFASISTVGWALPIRSNFRFSLTQKKILYKLFMNGEQTGQKMSAEEAELEVRKQLTVSDYVTSQQIKSLFSRWSKQYRNGTIEHIDLEDGNDEADAMNDFDDDERNAAVQANLIRETCETIIQQAADPYMVDDWIALRFGNTWFPAQTVEVKRLQLTV